MISIPINLEVIASPDIDMCAVVVVPTIYSNETAVGVLLVCCWCAVGVLSRPHRLFVRQLCALYTLPLTEVT